MCKEGKFIVVTGFGFRKEFKTHKELDAEINRLYAMNPDRFKLEAFKVYLQDGDTGDMEEWSICGGGDKKDTSKN